MTQAALLHTYEEVVSAEPGHYVVRSDEDAYFPAMAAIEDGSATFAGERYEEGGVHVVALTLGEVRQARNPEPQRGAITIGREFFITALKDYDDWQLKWWREAIQNAVDAGAKRVDLTSQMQNDGTWEVMCTDDGGGMTEDVLLNKFLVLGATTKIGESGAAGGFGKAKELLLLPWISWSIHTRDVVVDGSGIDYTVRRDEMRKGTRISVIMPSDKFTYDAPALSFIQRCYLPKVRFVVNGVEHKANLTTKQLVTSVEGKVDIFFTPLRSGKQPYLLVRAKGLFMFSKYVGDVPGYVIAEITAPSIDILTANRDGFRDRSVGREVDDLANKIAKDNISALKSKAGMIRQKFEGSGKFRARRLAAGLMEQVGPAPEGKKLSQADSEAVLEVIDGYARRDEEAKKSNQLPSKQVAKIMLDQKFAGPTHLAAALKQLVWEPDFFIINDREGWKVPKKFFPEAMSKDVLTLAKAWVEMIRYVMMQLGSDREFGVGWVFSEDMAAAALTTEHDDGSRERWLVLNPFVNMKDGQIWKPSNDADLKWLYAAAVHESTHIADGLQYHDESFAAALTLNMAKTADGYTKIKAIVADIAKSKVGEVLLPEERGEPEPVPEGVGDVPEFYPVADQAAAVYLQFATKGSYSLDSQGMYAFLRRYINLVKAAGARGVPAHEAWDSMWRAMADSLPNHGYVYEELANRVRPL